VIRWQPRDDKHAWNGLVSRPAKLPGIARWQLETREPRSEIRSVDFSPNGQQIACGTAAGHIRIYDANMLALLKLIPAHALGVHAVAFRPDGTRLASAGSDGLLRIWSSQGQSRQNCLRRRSSGTSTEYC
jgi:WD40 repeat protein